MSMKPAKALARIFLGDVGIVPIVTLKLVDGRAMAEPVVADLVGAGKGPPRQRAERRKHHARRRALAVETFHADGEEAHPDADRFRHRVNVDGSNEVDADAVTR